MENGTNPKCLELLIDVGFVLLPNPNPLIIVQRDESSKINDSTKSKSSESNELSTAFI